MTEAGTAHHSTMEASDELLQMLRHHAEPLPSPDEGEAFGSFFDRFGAWGSQT